MNRKGFTLVELIMSVLFIAVIFTTITAMWAVSSGIFSDTSSDTVAHNEAMAYEGILRGAILSAESMEIKGDFEDINDPVFLAEHIIFGFYQGYYSVSYFANEEDYESHTVLSYDSLDTSNQVQIRFEEVGFKPKLEYRIGKKKGDGDYWVEGGVVLDHFTENAISIQEEWKEWTDLEGIGFLCFER